MCEWVEQSKEAKRLPIPHSNTLFFVMSNTPVTLRLPVASE
jgi:hypothetical protein